jgi:diamine N-acetyltransferase
MLKFKQATIADAEKIAKLAAPIWQEHYTPIIGAEQVAYMLEKFQSAMAIKQQIESGMDYVIALSKNRPVGYMATEKRRNSLFISKFYLSSKFRGKGYGRQMLDKLQQIAGSKQCQQLELTVNKFNPAYQVYLNLGFENVESIQFDIGNGFIMDDYRMLKPLESLDYE